MRNPNTPFRPIFGSTIQCSATTTAARVAIPAIAQPATHVRVVHTTGTSGVRWRSGKSTVDAVTLTDPLQVAGNAGEIFGINAADTHISVITDSGTGTLEFTFGSGS